MPIPTLTREQRKRFAAEKPNFDKEAKQHPCNRCGSGEVSCLLTEYASTKHGVLPFEFWLCRDCSKAFSDFMFEIPRTKADAFRPQLKAMLAELGGKNAETMASWNKHRDASGLPPLPEPEDPPTPKGKRKPAKKPKKPKESTD